MKICFVLQRRFAYMGNAIASRILEHHPDTAFCGFVETRKSLNFLTKQPHVAYSSLLLDEDIHRSLFDATLDETYLAQLEKEYGIPNLWPYLYIDRVITHGQLIREYPHDRALLSLHDMKRLVQVTAQAITEFLDREKPDVVVGSVFGSVGSLMLYHMARKRGIRTVSFEHARIKNRISFSDDFHTLTAVRERLKEIDTDAVSLHEKEARDFLREFRAAPAPYNEFFSPTYNNQAFRRSNVRFLAPQKLFKSAPWYAKRLIEDLFRGDARDYSDIVAWNAIWDIAKRKIRGLRGSNDLTTAPDWNARFAYYPLHYDPEIATMLHAPYYTNQLELIRAAAHALPFDMLLYVKDHPVMSGYRPRRYYKEIARIPNVRLIPAHVPGYELSRRAAITITITGTGGWESALFGKPVITFGDVFYNDLPDVISCRNFEQLPFLIQKQLTEFKHDEKALVRYVSALFETSIPVDYVDLWNKAAAPEVIAADPGMHNLADALARYLRLT